MPAMPARQQRPGVPQTLRKTYTHYNEVYKLTAVPGCGVKGSRDEKFAQKLAQN